MLRKLSLICALAAILLVPTTPTFAGKGHGHGHHGHGHHGHGHWRGHGGWGGWGWGGWWGVPLGIGIATSLYAPRRCWSPSYGYYPCRYRYGWGY
jgi:hypothetical protein